MGAKANAGPKKHKELEEWDTYLTMPQAPAAKVTNWNAQCMTDNVKAFFKPIIFGKLTAKPRDYPAYVAMFITLELLDATLSNATAHKIYMGLMGRTWFAKFKAKMKKIGNNLKNASLKIHHKISAGLKGKGSAKGKTGLKLKIHKPKITGGLKIKAKTGVKAKGGLKIKAKGGVKAKKMRRLQTAETNISSGKGGLDTTKYAKDVNVPELKGDSDQTAPKSSNLIKFAFMLFAALITFF